MLVDPVQVVFLPDPKGLESDFENFVDGFIFLLGFRKLGSLSVKVPIPVLEKWVSFKVLTKSARPPVRP